MVPGLDVRGTAHQREVHSGAAIQTDLRRRRRGRGPSGWRHFRARVVDPRTAEEVRTHAADGVQRIRSVHDAGNRARFTGVGDRLVWARPSDTVVLVAEVVIPELR